MSDARRSIQRNRLRLLDGAPANGHALAPVGPDGKPLVKPAAPGPQAIAGIIASSIVTEDAPNFAAELARMNEWATGRELTDGQREVVQLVEIMARVQGELRALHGRTMARAKAAEAQKALDDLAGPAS